MDSIGASGEGEGKVVELVVGVSGAARPKGREGNGNGLQNLIYLLNQPKIIIIARVLSPPPLPSLSPQVIMSNRRLQYEERASASPLDYDNWFDYLRLEESTGDLDRTREASGRKQVVAGRRPILGVGARTVALLLR